MPLLRYCIEGAGSHWTQSDFTSLTARWLKFHPLSTPSCDWCVRASKIVWTFLAGGAQRVHRTCQGVCRHRRAQVRQRCLNGLAPHYAVPRVAADRPPQGQLAGALKPSHADIPARTAHRTVLRHGGGQAAADLARRWHTQRPPHGFSWTLASLTSPLLPLVQEAAEKPSTTAHPVHPGHWFAQLRERLSDWYRAAWGQSFSPAAS